MTLRSRSILAGTCVDAELMEGSLWWPRPMALVLDREPDIDDALSADVALSRTQQRTARQHQQPFRLTTCFVRATKTLNDLSSAADCGISYTQDFSRDKQLHSPCGLMDKAPPFQGGDCGFESRHGLKNLRLSSGMI